MKNWKKGMMIFVCALILVSCDDFKVTSLGFKLPTVTRVVSPDANLIKVAASNKDAKLFCGIDYSSEMMTNRPFYSVKKKSTENKPGISISSLITEEFIEGLEGVDVMAKQAIDLRKLYSLSFLSKWDDKLPPLSWNFMIAKRSHAGVDYENCWVKKGGEKLTVSYIDALPTNEADAETVALNLNYRVDDPGQIALYRSLELKGIVKGDGFSANIILSTFMATDISWEDKDSGELLHGELIPAQWLFKSLDKGLDIASIQVIWKGLKSDSKEVSLSDCYYVVTKPVKAGEEVNRAYAGAILEITSLLKPAKGRIICQYPYQVDDSMLKSN